MQKIMTPEQALSLAARLYDQGDLVQAEAACLKVINASPRFHPAYYQLALIFLRLGRLSAAAENMAQAAALSPASGMYHRSICEVYRRLGRLDQALFHGRESVRLSPEVATSHYNLGVTLSDDGNFRQAAECFRNTLAINPRHNFAANNLGAALEKMNDTEGARAAYAAAIAIDPAHAEAQNNLGAIFMEQGEVDKARECFAAAVAVAPLFLQAHYNLSALKKYTLDDPHLQQLESIARQANGLSCESATRLWFALGKAREDVGDYDASFDAYKKGNALKRSTFRYDETSIAETVDNIIARFNDRIADKIGHVGYRDETPIFIVGMPRSGTTLIEQILSSHTALHGAGELTAFDETLREKIPGFCGPSLDWLQNAPDEVFAELGKGYINRLRARSATAARITDKMPGNFFYAGLICLSLPGAKIIHAYRDPLDTCLSNYGRLFNEHMPYAYDLREIGGYFRQYQRLMDHWRKILPASTMLDVSYENVVADLEGKARRLISHAGLDWQNQCLDFHHNTRPVKTASAAQVRQPLYNRSVNRWKNFERHLEPLKEIICNN